MAPCWCFLLSSYNTNFIFSLNNDTHSKNIVNAFEGNVKENNKRRNICLEILKEHIRILKEHNKNILFVYINNAKASQWLNSSEEGTAEMIDDIPVFYGGMLSGMREMDEYSKRRLIKEIKTRLSIE